MDTTKTITHVSLCAGYGGIDLGLKRAIPNLRTVAFCEIEAFAAANLVAKMEEGQLDVAPIWTNLKTFPWAEFSGRVDILSGGYPCFEAGTLILTRDAGYIPIESVRVGQLVLTHLGNWRPVTATMRKSGADTIGIKPTIGLETRCTGEHPYYVRRRLPTSPRSFSNPEWANAVDVCKHHRVGVVAPTSEEGDDHAEEFWWLTGRYVACGWRADNNGKGRVIIACNGGKLERLQRMAEGAGFSPYLDRGKSCHKLHFTRISFHEWCGQFGDGAHNKTLPGWVLGIEPRKLRAFVDGYMSGDGHTEPKGQSAFTTTSDRLALGMALAGSIARGKSFGVCKHETEPTTTIEGRTVNQSDWYRVTFANTQRRGFIDGGYRWGEVKSCGGSKGVDVYNISVDGDESYVANGCIVHNCQPFSSAGKRLGKDDPRHLWPFIADGIKILKPRTCFFENVDGHVSMGLSAVISDLEEMGYKTTWGIFSASEVGAPHQRKRVFILGELANSAGTGAWDDLSRIREGAGGDDRGEIQGGQLANDLGEREKKRGAIPRAKKLRATWNFSWPSRPGEPQHAWEPPRVI